jgi:hypothetical protein
VPGAAVVELEALASAVGVLIGKGVFVPGAAVVALEALASAVGVLIGEDFTMLN